MLAKLELDYFNRAGKILFVKIRNQKEITSQESFLKSEIKEEETVVQDTNEKENIGAALKEEKNEEELEEEEQKVKGDANIDAAVEAEKNEEEVEEEEQIVKGDDKTDHDYTCKRKRSEEIKKFECDICFKKYRYLIKHKRHSHNITGDIYLKCDRCDKSFTSGAILLGHIKREHLGIKRKRCKCSHCDRTFPSGFHAKHHEFREHRELFTDKIYECDKCGKQYGAKEKLAIHMKDSHTDQMVACKICGKKYRPQSMRIHMKITHDTKKIPCEQCGKVVKSRLMKKHVKNAHSLVERAHMCSVCGGLFKAKATLEKHMTMFHSGSDGFTNDGNNLQCDHCEKTYQETDRLTMYKHLRAKHGIVQEQQKGRIVTCKVCGKLVPHSTFAQHMGKNHPSQETLKAVEAKCSICYQVFDTAKYLNDHQSCESHIPNLTVTYKCDQCFMASQRKIVWLSKSAICKHNAESHQRIVHPCEHCDFVAKTKQSHKAHVTHVHEKPVFECDICHKTVGSEGQLREHKRNLHPEGALMKNYLKCKYCSFEAGNKKELVKHRNEHPKNFDCSECPFMSISYKSLRDHMRKKHNISAGNHQMIKCPHCPRTFFTQGMRAKHILKIHKQSENDFLRF